MPLIHFTHVEEEAHERGVNVHGPFDANGDGKIMYWTYQTHIGLCLSDREMNGYNDSDWYMKIWNEETQTVEETCFASTRGWSYPCYGSSPDATPEVCAKANAFERANRIACAIGSDKKAARRPQAGRKVKVIAGRKLKKGGEYIVHHVIESSYGQPRYIGFGVEKSFYCYLHPLKADGSIDRAAALVATAESNLEVIAPEQYETPREVIERDWASYEVYFPRTKANAA